MINNNTQQKPTTTTTTKVSESSVYLKKSELPKDVSSFRNDAGYITSSSLGVWLKEHSYIPKSEINTLISKVDISNKSIDSDTILNHTSDITLIKREIVEIKDNLSKLDITGGYIPASKESTFATKTDISNVNDRIDSINTVSQEWVEAQGYLTEHQDISGKADKSELAGYVKTNTLNKYLKKTDIPSKNDIALKSDIPSIEGLASESWVESKGYLTQHQSLSAYAKRTELSGLASKEWVEEQGYLKEHQDLSEYVKTSDLGGFITVSTLSKYAKKSDLDGLATETWVENQGYLTEHQDISGKADKSELDGYVKTNTLNKYLKKTDMPDRGNIALKSDIPSVDGFATQEWVEDQGYLTQHQSLSAYAKRTELSGLASKEWVESQGFLTELQDMSEYAKTSDLNDYVKTTTFSSTLVNYVKKNALNNYATQEWVENQGYLTEHQQLDGYAKKTDLNEFVSSSVLNNRLQSYAKLSQVYTQNAADNKFLSKEEAEALYPSITEISDTYLGKDEARDTYLAIEDWRGFKDATLISDTYKDMSTEDFTSNTSLLTTLNNGFYIVNEHGDTSDIVIVKGGKPVNIFKEGQREQVLEWHEIY